MLLLYRSPVEDEITAYKVRRPSNSAFCSVDTGYSANPEWDVKLSQGLKAPLQKKGKTAPNCPLRSQAGLELYLRTAQF